MPVSVCVVHYHQIGPERDKRNGLFWKGDGVFTQQGFYGVCSRNGVAVSLITNLVCKEGFVETNTQNIQACMEKKNKFLTQLKKNNIAHRGIDGMSLSVELLNIPIEKEVNLAPYGVSIRKNDKDTFNTHVYICNHVSEELLLEVIDILM